LLYSTTTALRYDDKCGKTDYLSTRLIKEINYPLSPQSGGIMAQQVGYPVRDLRSPVQILVGHCRATLDNLFTAMCLCHQAVQFGTG